ncbi:hypothetical protein [Dysgonomonas mossii]|uniref:hypothetical protein n=1 Tax=Dysgonomonas mossii TaxID=163665 RepID=UPI00208E46EB|nr:hypothetical protein [Dysgonomonas mossii]
MEEVISWVLKFIRDNTVSLGKKAIFIFCFIIILVCINEYTGFIYYYPLNKEVEIIKNIEEAKEKAKDNPKLIEYLNDQEEKVVNRTYLHEKIWTSLKSIEFSELTNGITTYQSRSLIWHILTSTTILIAIGLVLVYIIIVFPFMNVSQKWITWFGSVIFLIPIIILIWLVQFLWALIPIIFYPWVNYSVQLSSQVIIILLINRFFQKNKKRLNIPET